MTTCLNLPEKVALLAEYQRAELAVLCNQEYSIKDRTFVKADLRSIQKGIYQLKQSIAACSGNGTIRIRKSVFKDD